MFKIRIPYGGVIALIVGLATGSLSLALWTGIILELTIATILFRSLTSREEFAYDSFIGHLLIQYTLLPEVGLSDVLHLICGRLAAYIFGLLFIDAWLIFPVILYLSTIIHYLPQDTRQ